MPLSLDGEVMRHGDDIAKMKARAERLERLVRLCIDVAGLYQAPSVKKALEELGPPDSG